MTTMGADEDIEELDSLIEASPDRVARTSASAQVAFLAGLVAASTAPFTAVQGLSLVTAVVAIAFVVGGMATTSRPHVAGRALVPAGLLLALAALGLAAFAYAGFDVTFGDGFVPTLGTWLEALRDWLRLP